MARASAASRTVSFKPLLGARPGRRRRRSLAKRHESNDEEHYRWTEKDRIGRAAVKHWQQRGYQRKKRRKSEADGCNIHSRHFVLVGRVPVRLTHRA